MACVLDANASVVRGAVDQTQVVLALRRHPAMCGFDPGCYVECVMMFGPKAGATCWGASWKSDHT